MSPTLSGTIPWPGTAAETLRAPGPGYYLIVLAGLTISLGVIASTFPLLDRITGPEVARNE